MAGTIVVSDIRSDNDNTIVFTANTGETIFTANLSSGISSSSLSNTGVTAAVYGGASQIPVVTVDEKGRITSAANVAISVSPASSSNISAGDSNVAVVDSGTGRVDINVDGSTRAIFNQYGLGLGPNVPSSGYGIRFPASQSASSDANTLDDYEEGTFTPTLSGGFSSAPTSYTTQTGGYVKIGKIVYFQLDLNPNGSVASGTQVAIAGFPFTSSTQASGFSFGGASVSFQESFSTLADCSFHFLENSTNIRLFASNGTNVNGDNGSVNINNRIILFGAYFV